MMHRALTDQQRRGAFAVAAVLVLGVVAVMSALDGGRHGHGDNRNAASAATRSPASSAPRIVDASAATSSSTASTSTTSRNVTTSAARTTRPAGARRLILADARRFLSAYLVYEVRPLDTRGRATLRASTTPGFARHLLRVRVNLPARNRPSVGRVRTLRFEGRPGRTTATVVATVQTGAWVSGLRLWMRHRDGRWLVSGLR